jgi:hypothetical protein
MEGTTTNVVGSDTDRSSSNEGYSTGSDDNRRGYQARRINPTKSFELSTKAPNDCGLASTALTINLQKELIIQTVCKHLGIMLSHDAVKLLLLDLESLGV